MLPRSLIFALLSLSLLATTAALAADPLIRVGVSAGPMERIVEEAVVPAGKREGLDIRPVVFSGYVNANQPLDDGDIEANAFQHGPFLRGQVAAHGYHLSPVGYTLSAPLGIYSFGYMAPNYFTTEQ